MAFVDLVSRERNVQDVVGHWKSMVSQQKDTPTQDASPRAADNAGQSAGEVATGPAPAPVAAADFGAAITADTDAPNRNGNEEQVVKKKPSIIGIRAFFPFFFFFFLLASSILLCRFCVLGAIALIVGR